MASKTTMQQLDDKISIIFEFLESMPFNPEQINKSIKLIDELCKWLESKIKGLNDKINNPFNSLEETEKLKEIKNNLFKKEYSIREKYFDCLITKAHDASQEKTAKNIAVLIDQLKSYISIKENDNTGLSVFELKNNVNTLTSIHNACFTSPSLTNNEIDLYKTNSNQYTYLIFSHNKKEFLGEINCIYENISYNIRPSYRGNNYSLLALNLLSDQLYKDGIKEFYIAAEKTNIASLKIAKKFGGEQKISHSDNVVVYKCDLNKIKNNNRK